MIILYTLVPPDQHWPGQWQYMYPGINSRDLAQCLQVANGIILQNDYATWQTWQAASSIQYLNTNTPQVALSNDVGGIGISGALPTSPFNVAGIVMIKQ